MTRPILKESFGTKKVIAIAALIIAAQLWALWVVL